MSGIEGGGDGDSCGAARIFLEWARDEAQNLSTPKISFLLGFRPLYFGNIKNPENQTKEKNKMTKNGSGYPDPLTSLVGG